LALRAPYPLPEGDGDNVQRGHPGQRVEIAIAVGDCQPVSQGARGDEAVDAGTDGVPGAARRSVEMNRLVENLPGEG
jgi:hypothetical protein